MERNSWKKTLPKTEEELKDADGQLTYKRHHISKMTSRTQFTNAYTTYINAILDNIDTRFPDKEPMTSFSILALRPLSFITTG